MRVKRSKNAWSRTEKEINRRKGKSEEGERKEGERVVDPKSDPMTIFHTMEKGIVECEKLRRYNNERNIATSDSRN